MMPAISGCNTLFRFTGRIEDLDSERQRELENRSMSSDPEIISIVSEIIERVRQHGDSALFDLASDLDGVTLERLEVPQLELTSALESITPGLRAAMMRSARNIAQVHTAFAPTATTTESEPGVVITRRPDPLERIGIYAPGGKAAYASSVLMAAVPARVAGVAEIVMCTPPCASGLPSREVLAAAAISGVDRVFAIGGAGAIAAMALGTKSVPRVDKVVGPGNAFVAEAKIQLAREVAIDCPAGPSELVIIADDSACPAAIAREVLAQAEHDARAMIVVLAIGESVAAAIDTGIVSMLSEQPRRDIIEQAFQRSGGILVAKNVTEALSASNAFAPEHLLIATRDAEQILEGVRCAGTVFVGEASSVAFGDYMTGANHVLPTGGAARVYSGLSTLDFVRWTTVQRVSAAAASRLAVDTASFAAAENLPGHATAAFSWTAP